MTRPKSAPKKISISKTEEEEREFWDRADSTEYLDWSKARVVRTPSLRPSTTPISVRIPDTLLTELKLLANERDVPYQSLHKMYLADRVTAEHRRTRKNAPA